MGRVDDLPDGHAARATLPPLYVGGDGRPYRPVREAELRLAERDLGYANTWDFFTRFARDVYGPSAARIAVTGQRLEHDLAAWPLPDEPARILVVAVEVADVDGAPLAPDRTTPFWQVWAHQPAIQVLAEEERAEAMAETLQSYAADWPFITTEHEIYWVAAPPVRQGPSLSVLEPDP